MSDWDLYGTKDQQLQQLKAKLYQKQAAKAGTTEVDRNPVLQSRSTSESRDECKRKDQLREAQEMKKEKQEAKAAKKKVMEKIEADKEARKAKAEAERQARRGPGRLLGGPNRGATPRWYDSL